MTTLLLINASARKTRSISRRMSTSFLEAWKAHHPNHAVIDRDVGMRPPPAVSETWIAACFKPEDQRDEADHHALSYSDAAIAELEAADVIVLAVPMYNYGMPSTLKAWFDMVIRIGKTFSFDSQEKTWPLSPILHGKKLVILSVSGEFAFDKGGIRETWNHLDPHIRTCAHYIGVAATDIHHVAVEYQEFGDDRHDASVEVAFGEIPHLVAKLAKG